MENSTDLSSQINLFKRCEAKLWDLESTCCLKCDDSGYYIYKGTYLQRCESELLFMAIFLGVLRNDMNE